LSAAGWHVYAGVRTSGAGAALTDDAPAVEPIRLDVTDSASIREAARRIGAERGQAGLDGLVNNAGIAVGGPLELVRLDDMRRQFEVNVIGQLAVTQEFLPMLRAARGRIVLMSSVSGRIGHPFIGPYAASKFALEALGDALRAELRSSRIQVSLVEPGAVATSIWDKGRVTIDETIIPAQHQRLYGQIPVLMRAVVAESARNGVPPQRVADVVLAALTATRPRSRYVVGRDAKIAITMRRFLPDRTFDRLTRRTLKL
jgi:NAD(P)-dependent dehydrogenase (short-subunit alcohol dehydrogenase family)